MVCLTIEVGLNSLFPPNGNIMIRRPIPSIFLLAWLFASLGLQIVHATEIKKLMEGQAFKWNRIAVDLGPLKKFYKSRGFLPVWTDKEGLNRYGEELVQVLKNAGKDGLETRDYIGRFSAKKLKKTDLGQAELFLSQAFWKFARDLYAGRTTPSLSDPGIVIKRKKIEIVAWLQKANRMGAQKVIDELRPPHRQYQLLTQALAKVKRGSSKARKIIVNLERWRWLPRKLGTQHVLVNQAAFEMYIRKNGQIVDRRKVVVGKPYHKTPMFSHAIKFAEFNPRWNVPRSIATEEFLPRIKRDPRYLARNHYELYESWDEDAKEIDPLKVNWRRVNARNFEYRIVQKTGKKNALGKVKFLFPNKFKVYLHDTNAKRLFNARSRAFSHGCIRIERPLDFAEKIFKGSFGMGKSKIKQIVDAGELKKVKLRRPLPIHLAYFTAWASENGKVKYYKDVYHRDRMVSRILFGRV